MIEIKCFGSSRSIADGGKITVHNDQMTVVDLKDYLNSQYGEQLAKDSYMIAVNQEYALDETIIHAGDEVAIIPPVSGG